MHCGTLRGKLIRKYPHTIDKLLYLCDNNSMGTKPNEIHCDQFGVTLDILMMLSHRGTNYNVCIVRIFDQSFLLDRIL